VTVRHVIHAPTEALRRSLSQRLTGVALTRSELAVSVAPDGVLHLCLHRAYARSLHVQSRLPDAVASLQDALAQLGSVLARETLLVRRVVVVRPHRERRNRVVDSPDAGGMNPHHGSL
jgi:hypothetical protein